ncbi:MAG: hypothetical protein ABIU87_12510 [Ornithinibacter sp.]
MPRTPRTVTLAEEGPRSPRQRRIAAGVALAVVAALGTAAYLGVRHLGQLVTGEECQVTASAATFDWAPDQASNAAAITAIGLKRELPPRAASIAIATAMQESKVRNVRFGDRDSLGLFQQRPSQGWGTAKQILDPEYSTNKFFDALVKVKGYDTMDIAKAAQAVQRSAAGDAYVQHEAKARVTASVLSGQTHGGIGCALKDPQASGDPEAVAQLLAKDFGLKAAVDPGTVTLAAGDADTAWAVASWAVARATETGAVRVTLAGREWRRTMTKSALSWQGTGSAGTAADATRVVIHLT